MNVLFGVWELDPFIKIGGLGDVARSLPGALLERGVDIRCILPFYNAIKLGKAKIKNRFKLRIRYAGRNETVELIETINPANNVPVYLAKHRRYFAHAKHPDTYALLSLVMVTIAADGLAGWKPDVLHSNDVHTALVPLLARELHVTAKTMLTIHNIAHQGPTSLDILDKIGIPHSRCRVLQWEIASRKINFLTEGIIHADVVTTVSPTYSREILTEKYGHGLEDILRGKEGRLFGILNGIDQKWRQRMMQSIRQPYRRPTDPKSIRLPDWHTAKPLNKASLQRKLGLRVDPETPVLAYIGRMDPWQKGIDLIHKMLRKLEDLHFQFVLLCTGNADWEERFLWLYTFYPKEVSCNFVFDETLAHQIYAGSDFLLIPSRYEPCGLIQMIAMYFGTIPIARRTGGLSDSIWDNVNGFLFDAYTSEALEASVQNALNVWRNHRMKFETMVEAAMKADFSWEQSAQQYLRLYEKVTANEL